MNLCPTFCRALVFAFAGLSLAIAVPAQAPPQSSSSARHRSSARSGLDSGSVTNGVYRNRSLALTCKVPEGWVLRTDELNARDESDEDADKEKANDTPAPPPASSAGAKVLLAAFSRPPEARGEEINSSIVIAAESISSYPGLKEAAQYFGPLTEVAKAQGFIVDEEPYEIAFDSRTLVRADFHKDVGSRVMRQSTLALLSHGYAISITVIGGTEGEVEDLIDSVSFTARAK